MITMSAGLLISTSLAPTVLAVENSNTEITLDSEEIVFDESNPNYVEAVEALQNEHPEVANVFIDQFEGRTINSDDLEDEIDELLDALDDSSSDLDSEAVVGEVVEPASISGAIGAIIAIMTAVAADIGAAYQLGQYGARQAIGRGILTREEYQANPGRYRAGITAVFGPTTALGFDDYMYDI